MEEAKLVAFLVTNIGGMGTLAFVLLHLLKDALKAFREEIATERKAASDALTVERNVRVTERSEDRAERNHHHGEVVEKLNKIQSEVAEVKQLILSSDRGES